MHLSAPIFRLKRKAKRLARRQDIALNVALDRVASEEGFRSWGQMTSFHQRSRPEAAILTNFKRGEMLILAARPGQGKTVLGLQLLMEAAKKGRKSLFLSSEYSDYDLEETLTWTGSGRAGSDAVEIDLTDDLSAGFIIDRLSGAPEETIAVVDYLQVMDQRRASPDLASQIAALRAFADAKGVRLVFLSQVHRSYDPDLRPLPGVEDVRLPNPVDLSLFDKGCFLHDGEMCLRPL